MEITGTITKTKVLLYYNYIIREVSVSPAMVGNSAGLVD